MPQFKLKKAKSLRKSIFQSVSKIIKMPSSDKSKRRVLETRWSDLEKEKATLSQRLITVEEVDKQLENSKRSGVSNEAQTKSLGPKKRPVEIGVDDVESTGNSKLDILK